MVPSLPSRPTPIHVLKHNSVLIFKDFPQQRGGEEETGGNVQKEARDLERKAEEDENGGGAGSELQTKVTGGYRFRRHMLGKANKVEDCSSRKALQTRKDQ